MQNERVQEVLRQIETLSADEKRSLVDCLSEQARKDAAITQSPDQNLSQDEFDPLRRREYEWLRQHRDEYAGQYVALDGDNLIAHAPTLRELYSLARKTSVRRPFVVRIEAADEPPFGGW